MSDGPKLYVEEFAERGHNVDPGRFAHEASGVNLSLTPFQRKISKVFRGRPVLAAQFKEFVLSLSVKSGEAKR